MSNSYFQFKQFTVQQGSCAMKVSTDACIQGAWVPLVGVQHVLDIGAGTGLLSLMIAQRSKQVLIDAIELDKAAALQATENVAASPWRERVRVMQADARTYNYGGQYDMIVCNPPFFQNSLQGDGAARNMARHNDSLTYDDLMRILTTNLRPNGYACILLPYAEHAVWEALISKKGWGIQRKLVIRHREQSKPTRVVSICVRINDGQTIEEQLVIKDGADNYTAEFRALLKDFYLHL